MIKTIKYMKEWSRKAFEKLIKNFIKLIFFNVSVLSYVNISTVYFYEK